MGVKQSENDAAQKPAKNSGRQGQPQGTGPLQARLRPDLVLLPLDEDVVAFSEEIQRLAGLNASAAHLVRRMQSGVPVSALAEELVSDGWAASGEADGWVTTVLEALGSQGFLANQAPVPAPVSDEEGHDARMVRVMPPLVLMEAVAEQRYQLLGTCALVRFTHLSQVRHVDCIIGHLKTDAATTPTITLHLNSKHLANGHLHTDVYLGSVPVGYAPRLGRLGPLVKGAFWSAAINAHHFLFYIHAGTVGTDGACVLLPAAPGSGKSSLTAALTHRGLRYFSDEVALIEPDTFMVNPMPLAFCAKSTGWDLLARYYPEILSVPTHLRSDGKVVRYVAPPADRIQKGPGSISHIVFPHYDKDSKTELQPIARSEALGRLMTECLGKKQQLDRNNVEQLIRWISGIQCYALPFSSLEDAAELVTRAIAR
jgi:hypothetical protein